MKNVRAADKSHAGGDEKHDINFHWPNVQFEQSWRSCKLMFSANFDNIVKRSLTLKTYQYRLQ